MTHNASVYVLKSKNIFALEMFIDGVMNQEIYKGFTAQGKLKQIGKKEQARMHKSNYQVEQEFLNFFSEAGLSLFRAFHVINKLIL